MPERQEPGQVVVAAFDRFFVHQPVNTDGSPLGTGGKQAGADAVIAARMIPEVRQRANSQRTDVRFLVVAHEGSDLFAVHRFAHPAVRQRRAVGGEPDVLIGVGKDRHPRPSVCRRQPVGRPFFLAPRDDGVDPVADDRGGVVGVVVVEVGFDILRVIEVAVVTFAVVLPNHLPVRAHQVVGHFRHLRAPESLRLDQRRQQPAGRLERNRFLAERYENQAFDFLDVRGPEAELRLFETGLHAAAGEQLSVERVSPLMIGTNQARNVPCGFSADNGTAMAADVVMRVNCAFLAANDHQRVGVQFESEVVSGPGNFAGVTGEQPIGPPDPRDVQLVNFVIPIKLPRQGPARAAGREQLVVRRAFALQPFVRTAPDLRL